MYLLCATILVLKTLGYKIAWFWYILAVCEMFDAGYKKVKLLNNKNDRRI